MLIGIAVTFERPEVLRATLLAFERQTVRIDRLLVVDNGERRPAADAALACGAEYLRLGDNMGPAGGFAMGIRTVLETGAADDDWVLLIDDDDPPDAPDQVERQWQLAADLRACGRPIAAVGKVGARLSPWGILQRVADDELEGLVAVDFIGSGQLPLYSVAALRGCPLLFDHSFFGFEDLALGLELRARGFELFVAGEDWRADRRRRGRLAASRSALASRHDAPWRRYYSARNLVAIVRRVQGEGPALWASMHTLLGGLKATLRRRSPSFALHAVRGVLHAWMQVSGRTVAPEAKVAEVEVTGSRREPG